MDKKIIELIWYLLGDRKGCTHATAWNFSRKEPYPVVVSPMAAYLGEVNRFLFSGGLSVDVFNATVGDPRQEFLNKVIRDNSIQSILDSLWETGAVTGEILGDIELLENGSYKIKWYDATQFDYKKDHYDIKYVVEEDGTDCFFRKQIYVDKIVTYPLVPVSQERYFDWNAAKQEKPHTYGVMPCQLIKNRLRVGKRRGVGEFNFAACKMNVACIMSVFDGLENVHLFGNPMFASMDPDKMLAAIRKRIQVVQKETPEDGGAPEVLSFQAISAEHLDLIKLAKDNFLEFMGVSSKGDDVRGDVSSVTLKILNSSTISTAEKRWVNYVDDGIKPLLEKVMLMAGVDGKLGQINSAVYDSYKLTVHRRQPYFPESADERSKLAALASQLVDLGIDTAVALKETLYPGKSINEIAEMLKPGLEDVL